MGRSGATVKSCPLKQPTTGNLKGATSVLIFTLLLFTVAAGGGGRLRAMRGSPRGVRRQSCPVEEPAALAGEPACELKFKQDRAYDCRRTRRQADEVIDQDRSRPKQCN